MLLADNRSLAVITGNPKGTNHRDQSDVSEFIEISDATWEAHSTPARSRYGEYKCQNIRLGRRAMGG